MITILVANTKGGCGKTTVATHLAAAFANAGQRTVLADADRQHSSLEWARLRPTDAAPVGALDWSRAVTRPGVAPERLVIDAAAAMKKKHVFDLVRLADVIVVPVLPSALDQRSTAAFLARLGELKAIRKSRKPVAILGNRLRPRSKAASRLAAFLTEVEHADLGALPDRAIYNEVAGRGLSIFDLPDRRSAALRADWQALLDYVNGAY
jgi:chromosome partitioning protein